MKTLEERIQKAVEEKECLERLLKGPDVDNVPRIRSIFIIYIAETEEAIQKAKTNPELFQVRQRPGNNVQGNQRWQGVVMNMQSKAARRMFSPKVKKRPPQHDFLAKALLEAERAVKRAKRILAVGKREIDARIKAAMSNAPPDIDLWFMRNEENMTQKEVAELIGRSRSLVDRYEAGDPGRYYITILHVLVQHRLLLSGKEINWRAQHRRQV